MAHFNLSHITKSLQTFIWHLPDPQKTLSGLAKYKNFINIKKTIAICIFLYYNLLHKEVNKMEDKITTIRLPERYIEDLETIRKYAFEYTPDAATTTSLILFAIAYTASCLTK